MKKNPNYCSWLSKHSSWLSKHVSNSYIPYNVIGTLISVSAEVMQYEYVTKLNVT